jgi:sugar phosphate isomerase/epimerase
MLVFANRREFLQLASSASASRAVDRMLGREGASKDVPRIFPVKLGKVCWVGLDDTPDAIVGDVAALGLEACQIGFEHPAADSAASLLRASEKYGIMVTAISEHNPGPRVFNFYQGPLTIGIIPIATREARIRALKRAADIAVAAKVPAIHTHCGFIPEDPNDPLYPGAVTAVRNIAEYCKDRKIAVLCETGQETPITLLRLIEDVATGNVFVNLDVANLILYGKGNPVDAMDVFGNWVRGIHAKDGLFPTNPRELGLETPIGQGKVDFPKLFAQLKRFDYRGSMMIEREVGTDEQRRQDVLRSKKFLQEQLLRTYS